VASKGGYMSRIRHTSAGGAITLITLGGLAAAIAAVTLAGCAGSASSGSPPTSSAGATPTGSATPPSPQDTFAVALKDDKRALDQGVLSYRAPGPLKTGQTYELAVTVTDIGKHTQVAILSAQQVSQETGLVIFPKDVPTGGIVGLRIATCIDLTCVKITDERQAIASKGDSAEWEWDITAHAPGAAMINLTAATYAGASRTVLREEIVPIKLRVRATAAFTHSKAARAHHREVTAATGFVNTTAGLITTISGAVVAIAGAATWVASRVRRKSRKKQKQDAPPA
jgi:hypothetical protein